MLETGNGGYAYMDELAKYRIYSLHDMFKSRPWSSLRVGGTLRQCLAVWFVQGWYPFAPRPSLS